MTDDLSMAIATIKRLGPGYRALAIQELIGPAAKEIAELQNEAPYGQTPYSATVAAFDDYERNLSLTYYSGSEEWGVAVSKIERVKLGLMRLIEVISERQV